MRYRIAYLTCAAALGLTSGCKPSATVRRTTPVANLQSFRNVLVRVAARPNTERFKGALGFAATDQLRTKCGFDRVLEPAQAGETAPDLILDLSLQRTYRGGDGLIQNPNLATVDVTLVLSDGTDDELLGSAEIRGKSPAVASGDASPEEQAIGAVADRIAEIMVNSGCTGPRIARTPAAPSEGGGEGTGGEGTGGEGTGGEGTGGEGTGGEGTGGEGTGGEGTGGEGTGTDPGQPDDARARADAIDDQGKNLFRAGDPNGARAKFEEALALYPDPRYQFNLCLANEALNQLDAAVAACKKVLTMNPESRLTEKVNLRLEIIAERQSH